MAIVHRLEVVHTFSKDCFDRAREFEVHLEEIKSCVVQMNFRLLIVCLAGGIGIAPFQNEPLVINNPLLIRTGVCLVIASMCGLGVFMAYREGRKARAKLTTLIEKTERDMLHQIIYIFWAAESEYIHSFPKKTWEEFREVRGQITWENHPNRRW